MTPNLDKLHRLTEALPELDERVDVDERVLAFWLFWGLNRDRGRSRAVDGSHAALDCGGGLSSTSRFI